MTAERSSKAYTVTCNLDNIIHCFNSLCGSPACYFTSSEIQPQTRQQTVHFFGFNHGIFSLGLENGLYFSELFFIDDWNLVIMYLPGFNVKDPSKFH